MNPLSPMKPRQIDDFLNNIISFVWYHYYISHLALNLLCDADQNVPKYDYER